MTFINLLDLFSTEVINLLKHLLSYPNVKLDHKSYFEK